jgi:hypothetical protein
VAAVAEVEKACNSWTLKKLTNKKLTSSSRMIAAG